MVEEGKKEVTAIKLGERGNNGRTRTKRGGGAMAKLGSRGAKARNKSESEEH